MVLILVCFFFNLNCNKFLNANKIHLGGGRGYLSKNILAETLENLKVYDISQTMLDQAESTPGVNIEKNILTSEYLDVSYRLSLI